MGNWGHHSHEGDATWDCLYAKNIHKMTDKEVSTSLDKFVKNHPLPWDLSKKTLPWIKDFLGVVIHALFQGRRVPKVHLVRAKKITDVFLDPEMVTWGSNGIDSPEVKIKHLKIERAAIEQALKNKCRGKVKHCKGLMEQIDDFMSGQKSR